MSEKLGLDLAKAQVEAFHNAFGHPIAKTPTEVPDKLAVNRTVWTAEELVEFLYATADNDKEKFGEFMAALYKGIEKAEQKSLQGPPVKNKLVEQMDALTDVNYFVQGTFVVAGVNPQPLFDIVQEANMGKLWEDGKPRFREDGKILKPDNWEKDFAPEPRLIKEIEEQGKED